MIPILVAMGLLCALPTEQGTQKRDSNCLREKYGASLLIRESSIYLAGYGCPVLLCHSNIIQPDIFLLVE